MSLSMAEKAETAFSILPYKFPDTKEKIKTREFLNAASGTVSVIERFGKMFAPVIYDMNGNIKKLSKKFEEDEESHKYLEDMIYKEQAEGGMIATDALLWLRRGLNFLVNFYQSVLDDTASGRCSNDLSPFLKRAYQDTLERYHGWVGTQLFNVLARFAPNRRQLMYTLALEKHNQENMVVKDMQIYSSRLRGCIMRLTDFYIDSRLEPL